jgi:Domain of unknown function (DUF3883)
MDEEFRSKLSADHLERLSWFEDHVGQFSPAPRPLDGNRYLVSAPKGIFKPEGWDYALSVKVMHNSPYEDGQPTLTEGGGWRLSYHQEGEDPEFYTNAALRRCIRDRVPVGVLRKVDAGRRPSRYQVMGLALPVRWQEGYFLLEGLSPYEVRNGNSEEISSLPNVDREHRLVALRELEIAKTATVEDILETLRTLRVQRTGDGKAKRHQPLTLLWAIGRARKRAPRMVGWPVAKEGIGNLLREFGATHSDNAYLPFLALAGTGIWELTSMPPRGIASSVRRQWLNNMNPVVRGGLIQSVYDLLAGSADAAAEATLFLLDTYFNDMAPAELLRVLQGTGLEDLPEHSDDADPQASPIRSSWRSGAGRLVNTALRIAIESHAVRRAKDHYYAQHYEVTEVGKPYDLHAVKDDDELHVEVKGSILAADAVELTINEVRHAREVRTDLYVVDQIQWEIQVDGTISTTGGRDRHWPNWRPAEVDLTPTRYRYQLPTD